MLNTLTLHYALPLLSFTLPNEDPSDPSGSSVTSAVAIQISNKPLITPVNYSTLRECTHSQVQLSAVSALPLGARCSLCAAVLVVTERQCQETALAVVPFSDFSKIMYINGKIDVHHATEGRETNWLREHGSHYDQDSEHYSKTGRGSIHRFGETDH